MLCSFALPVPPCPCAKPDLVVWCAAAATSIIQHHETAKVDGAMGIERSPQIAVTDAVTPASVQQLRQELLSVVQELAEQSCGS